MSLEQLNREMAEVRIDSAEDSGGWEVFMKKSKKRAPSASSSKPWGSSTAKPWGHSAALPTKGLDSKSGGSKNPGNNWGQAVDSRKPAGRGNPRPQSNTGLGAAYMGPPRATPPPLQHGWRWGNRSGSTDKQPEDQDESIGANNVDTETEPQKQDSPSEDDASDDLLDDSDYDLSDDYDSHGNEKSFEMRKNNKWLKPFFDVLDSLKEEQINDSDRQWHCPACHDGPGAIDWYRGLQPLMTHAKTRGTMRVKLHREFAALLEEEVQKRGSFVVLAGEVFGKWRGLREKTADHEIVWPPMVVVMNTLLDKDENDKWIGMGNQELVDYFSNYATLRARHSYGPNGHRGMSVLIFEASAMGYMEAERLQKQFTDEGRDRDAWQQRRVLFYPGGKRKLYGFLATKEDLDLFNQHSAGKSRLKYEVKSYHEMVVIPMRKMSEDNQKLIWYKNRAAKGEQRCKAYEETFGVVTQKLREATEENRIVRLRTKMQHEENKEQMDYQESFFKEQIEKIHKDTDEKEQEFEKQLQEERAKAKLSGMDSGTNGACTQRKEEIESFISVQEKGVEEFEAEREKLIQAHKEKNVEMKRKHQEEEVELEKEFDAALTELMEKFTPTAFKASKGTY